MASKQGIHQLIERRMKYDEQVGYLSKLISEIRADHPTLSCRAMYFKIQPEAMGRDKFEAMCVMLGFQSTTKRNLHRTTNSSGVIRFENHLIQITLTGINQAYSSDITYYELNGRFYYITFVMDCYSRKILGHVVSKRLVTECTTLPALRLAIKNRNGKIEAGVIFHSDGGGQYYDKGFLKYTALHKMKNSMCEYAYENGKAERLNGVIKNNYLIHYKIKTYEELVKSVDRAVTLYNTDKPHVRLNYKSPNKFEKEIVELHRETKPKMTESFMAKSQ